MIPFFFASFLFPTSVVSGSPRGTANMRQIQQECIKYLLRFDFYLIHSVQFSTILQATKTFQRFMKIFMQTSNALSTGLTRRQVWGAARRTCTKLTHKPLQSLLLLWKIDKLSLSTHWQTKLSEHTRRGVYC